MRFFAFVLGAVAALSFSVASAAPPVRCASGYQDSSCAKQLTNPPQTPPECPSGAGWQTLADAVWIGSKYRDPVCKYSPPPSSCASGYSEASPATWNGTAWVGQQCVLIPPPAPTCPSGQTMTVPPTWDGTAWVGMQCVAPQAPQPPAPACPSGQTQTAAPSWDGSAWVGLQCTTPSTTPPPAPTCAAGQTQTAAPSWDGSAWVGLQCVTTQPPAPTCPSGQTQLTAPSWNGSAWVGLQCAVTPPAPPTCPSGQTQTVPPTWDGTAWVGLQCLPSQTPQPPTHSEPDVAGMVVLGYQDVWDGGQQGGTILVAVNVVWGATTYADIAAADAEVRNSGGAGAGGQLSDVYTNVAYICPKAARKYAGFYGINDRLTMSFDRVTIFDGSTVYWNADAKAPGTGCVKW